MTVAPALPAPSAARTAAGSAALDRTAIELGRVDPLASVHPGLLARSRTALFGAGRNYALADPRLEALRRYAVLYRASGGVPAAELASASGLTSAEEQRVRDVVDGWRPALFSRPSRQRWLAPAALVLAAACLVGNALW